MNIGDNIKKLRIEKRLKQLDLAEKSGISRVAIGNYERGDRIPNIEIVRKIATALDVPLNVLLDGNWEEYTEEIKTDWGTSKSEPIIAKQLSLYYEQLNQIGKREAVKRVSELAQIPEYTEKEK